LFFQKRPRHASPALDPFLWRDAALGVKNVMVLFLEPCMHPREQKAIIISKLMGEFDSFCFWGNFTEFLEKKNL
jgi:hypothetical protein